MFNSISTALKVVKNLDKIKEVVASSYEVVVKVLAVAKYLQTQLNDTKLGLVLTKYLPTIIAALVNVIAVVDKFGPLFGVNISAAASSEHVLDADDLQQDLLDSIDKLNGILK